MLNIMLCIQVSFLLLIKENTANAMEAMLCISLSHKVTDLLPESSKSYSDCGHLEALRKCQNTSWSYFMCLIALSSVLNLPIYSFHPDIKARYSPILSNSKIYLRKGFAGFVYSPINIFLSLVVPAKRT